MSAAKEAVAGVSILLPLVTLGKLLMLIIVGIISFFFVKGAIHVASKHGPKVKKKIGEVGKEIKAEADRLRTKQEPKTS